MDYYKHVGGAIGTLIYANVISVGVTCLNINSMLGEPRVLFPAISSARHEPGLPRDLTCVHRCTITGTEAASDAETAGDVVDIPQQRIPYSVDAHRTRIFGSILKPLFIIIHVDVLHSLQRDTRHSTVCAANKGVGMTVSKGDIG